jgi:serine/threonine-protein kinase OSR1/STK39
MPYIENGSLSNILRLKFSEGIKDEVLVASLLKQILIGLEYFHSKGFIHRDIKGENILVGQNGKCYLSDFGISTSVKAGEKKLEFTGSPCWMAPEVME